MHRGLGGKQADRCKDRFSYRLRKRTGGEREGKIQRGWKKSAKNIGMDMGADRGNQMCWDQTGYCRGNGWQTSGGVPPAEVLREGHLLSVCAGGGVKYRCSVSHLSSVMFVFWRLFIWACWCLSLSLQVACLCVFVCLFSGYLIYEHQMLDTLIMFSYKSYKKPKVFIVTSVAIIHCNLFS